MQRAAHSCRNEGVTWAYINTLTGMLIHGLLDLVRDHQPSFSIILVGKLDRRQCNGGL